jgi:hypothetical protein
MSSFIKISLICIIGKNWLKEKLQTKIRTYAKLLLAMWLQLKFGQLKTFLFLVTAAILNGGRGCRTQL